MRRSLAAWSLAGACGGGLPPCERQEFVALQSDFADYRQWPRFPINDPDLRLGTGARAVYINEVPPAGSTAFPRCTMIVKTAENDPDPTRWLMVAMAKRAGGVNPDGAVGWEWFDLDLTDEGTPLIDWRGPVPPEGRGYECSLGEDEAGADAVGDCNLCHRAGARSDFVLSPVLQHLLD